MWFDDEITGRRPWSHRSSRAKAVQRLKADVRGSDKFKTGRLALLVGAPVGLLVGLILLWFGVRAAGRALYSENPRFTITRLEVRAASPRTRALVREYTNLAEGMNIYGFDINAVREYVMKHAHGFLSMSISRQLPSTVIIEVVERTPLARVGQGGNLVADAEGHIFMAQAGSRDLPVIGGAKAGVVRPGGRVDDATQAALQVVEACDTPSLGLRVTSVAADNPEYLTVRVAYANLDREVKLAWPGMRERTPQSRTNLTTRLARLKDSFDSPEGQRMVKLDATFDGNIIGKKESEPAAPVE